MSTNGPDTPHSPGPSLWPIGFAVGVACLLLGLVISWIVAAIGAVVAVVFGFLWVRDVTRDVRDEVPAIEPETTERRPLTLVIMRLRAMKSTDVWSGSIS